MSGERFSILYVDDQKQQRDEFVARHGKRFEIHLADDISDVMRMLTTRSELPDLLLLDLYHDVDRSDAGHPQRVAEAMTALKNLRDVIQTVKRRVDAAWQPAALDTLRRVREQFSARDLPIMVYTQRGLLFLDEGQLRQVEDADAHWMVKYKGEHYEADRMRRVAEHRPRHRPARDITIAVVSVLAGAAISLAVQSLA